MSVSAAALTLWAKSGKPPLGLFAHMLDTAAVAKEILAREPQRTRVSYANDWSLPVEMGVAWVSFLAALHDLGKATPVFQGSWEEGARLVRDIGLGWDPILNPCFDVRADCWVAHGVFTELLLPEILIQKGVHRRTAHQVSAALGAHHGFPAASAEKRRADPHIRLEQGPWREVRSWLVDELAKRIGTAFPQVEEPSPQALLRLMALASVADWVASDPSFFPYGRDPMDRKYWFGAQERAKKALDAIGWRRFWRPPHRSFQELFGFAPNPLQEATARLLSGRIEEPLFLLVEAPMGMGKTEAALYAHHLLQQSLEHRGLYMALPTQATGSGLFPRVRAFLERVSSGVPLDLQLQHGTALLNPVYVSLLEKACPEQVGEREEGPLASSWFSARKRAMLSPHGVGTLDQALLGVLRVKHHFIRLWGLMNRVVILDEVHAYDVYTSGLLLALLRWLKALGSSAIVMTATLPSRRRRELLRAWSGDGSETLALGPYPRLLAAFGGGNFRAEPLPPVRAVEVALERVPVEVEKVASRLLSSLPGTLGAIVNTVERAQSLYRALGEGEPLTLREVVAGMEPGPGNGTWKELAEALDEKGDWVVGKRLGDGTLVFLLHARFPAEERALREAVVLILFGKEGLRPSRAVLVATQVAEQSLDLDFDLLYSDLAPIDLLFQRAGRLHRHDRERPPLHETPRLLLGLPEALAFGSPLHWSRIYEEFVLLATCLALEGRERLKIPQDLEALLEAVYEASPRAFPEPIRTQAEKSYARLEERFTREEELARKLSLSQLEKLLAYGDEADLVAELRLEDDEERPETQRLLTRLGDPSVAVVPVYRMGEGVFLDRERRRRAPLDGEIGREEAELLFRRGVRLSRYPLPQMLLKEETPTAWRKSGLLRGLRPLFLDRVFGEGRDAFQVELDPELGVVYRLVRSRHGLTD